MTNLTDMHGLGRYGTQLGNSERGVVLIVGLIMLLLLTIIGLASIRGSTLQEMMAGNMRDRNIAFQSAESALRFGELRVLSSPPAFDGTVNGFYADLNISGGTHVRPIEWTKPNWEAWSVQLGASTLGGVSEQPRYVAEKLTLVGSAANPGGGVDSESQDKFGVTQFYRVTSRGLGGTKDSEVILQSTVK